MTPIYCGEDGVRVLIAEDATVSACALAMQLRSLGYDVVGVFDSGEAVVTQVIQLRPDIILIDISLAGEMDGIETADRISREYDAPIIYLTSSTDDDTFHRARRTNPFAWLDKPASTNDLRMAISMALYRKNIFQQLERSEEKYRRIVETMSEGLVMLDGMGRINFANTRFATLLGSAESCVGTRLSDMLIPADAEAFVGGVRRLGEPFRNGAPAEICKPCDRENTQSESDRLVMQTLLAAEDGSYVPVRISASRWGMECGVGDCPDCGIVCVISDLTEQMAAAAALREAESRYRALFENALDGVFQSLPDGRFVDVNPALAAMFGFASPQVMVDEVVSLADQLYECPEDREGLMAALSGNELVNRYQVRVKRRDGSPFWAEITARAVRDPQGNTRYYEGMCLDITDRKVTEQDLRRRASRDDLTGLYNRVFFREWLHGALASATRKGNRLGVLYVDLDAFKQVNDSYGHLFGDAVLREMASRIREQVRECDMVARIGGDEFCVVLEGLHSPDDVCRVSRHISESLSRPITAQGRQVQLGASVGIAVFPDDGKEAEELLNRADEAMYRAKSQVGSGFCFWSEPHWKKSN